MTEEDELLEKLRKIEVREGKERTIKSYVLRNNVLEEREKNAVLKWAAKYCLFYRDEKLDFGKIFSNSHDTVIEIGFGNGEVTSQMALIKPEYNYIGIEVYLKGFVKLLSALGENGIENVRIMRFNAVDVLEHMIPDETVAGFHIFFPDPWPKKKHHKRRILNQDFLHLLARKLRKGGYIYIVTDWEEYAEEVLSLVQGEPMLFNPFYDYAPPVTWRPLTKFEQKGMNRDYTINEIWFEKR